MPRSTEFAILFWMKFSSFNWFQCSWQQTCFNHRLIDWLCLPMLFPINWYFNGKFKIKSANKGQDSNWYKKRKHTVKREHSWHSLLPNAMLFNDIRDVAEVQWLFSHLSGDGSLANHIDCIKWLINYVEIIWLRWLHDFRLGNEIFDLNSQN